ncbi:GDSL esterase/lipase [Glycine soja]
MFEQYQERLSAVVGAKRAKKVVNEALVLMTLGANDFVNNYFLAGSYYSERLYELGARRVLVTGTGPLGCVPSQLAMRSTNGECVPVLQQATQIFNPLLDNMTKDLNSQLGFVTSKMACCGQGPYNGLGPCNPLSSLCSNRDAYAFWDAFHPSQRALDFIVDGIFKGTSNLMSPMNLSTIMAMDSNI